MALHVRDDRGSVAALCENGDPARYATVTVEFNRLQGMATTRTPRGGGGGGVVVSDVVPPGHAQLIVVAFPTAEAYSYGYSLRCVSMPPPASRLDVIVCARTALRSTQDARSATPRTPPCLRGGRDGWATSNPQDETPPSAHAAEMSP